MPAENDIHLVKQRHSSELLRLPGVSGVGVAKGKDGNLVIAVHLDSDDAEAADRLPKQIEGYSVEAVRSGPFRKL